ncbi:MAG: hypothetical protein P9X27_03180, partial [Candidatus Kaelpia aquatica]|nr:hypothetical protein [Candidatus Kaelpia aquatica]
MKRKATLRYNQKAKRILVFLLAAFLLTSLNSKLYAADGGSSIEEERAKAQKLIQQEEKEARRQKQTKINSLYKEALSFYYEGNLTAAQETFELILLMAPDEKKAKRFIESKIPAREKKLVDINQGKAERESKKREEELSRLRDRAEKEAKRQEKNRERDQKKAELERERIQREAKCLIEKQRTEAEKEAKRQETKEKRAEKERELERGRVEKEVKRANQDRVNALYKEALSYYKEDNLNQSINTFQQVLNLDPDNKKVENYLNNKIPAKRERLNEIAERGIKSQRLEKEKELAQLKEKAQVEAQAQERELAKEEKLKEAKLQKQAKKIEKERKIAEK